jgi:ABC-type multidrug transport system fused ATPase/permease subunit
MKAMMMKGVATVLTPLDSVPPASRNAPRAVAQPKRQAGSPAAQPPEAEASDPNVLEPTIYRFILRHSSSQQLILILFTLISFPFLYFSLDLPKTIINRAIGGKQFPQHLFGIDFNQVTYLLILCGLFLTLVFINGGFKYYINTLKGRLGERMLRRLRYQLYHRMLRFPLSQFSKTSSAQIIPMITSECESLGGFIGDAFVTPVFQGGTLLTIIVFMFMQDPVLGAAAVALYPLQGYAIPKLQRKVNQLGKRRVRTVREVADRVHESAAGIVDIHANGAVKRQLTAFAHLLGTIYDIRFEIYQRKFFVKFLNNFIAQLTPFFFYAIGGYLVIRGDLSFGALVAVLAAYKDLASPWKELLDFYQIKEDSRIKYEQIVEQFQPAGMIDARLQMAEPQTSPSLTGELSVINLSFAEEDGSRVLDGISFTVSLADHIAVVGQGGSGKNELALLLARLVAPIVGGSRLAGSSWRSCRPRWSGVGLDMSARRPTCSPVLCATIYCSVFVTFR